MDDLGLLVMAYGTPAGMGDVEAYYTHIRHGRAPTPELLQELLGRYEAIGGCSPLNEITRAQADLLGKSLSEPPVAGQRVRVYVGMKHCAPFIAEAVKQMADDGVRQAVGVVLAPHYSTMSVETYIQEALKAAEEHGFSGAMEFVRQWHLQPAFLDALESRIRDSLARFSASEADRLKVLFTAHSLPERILELGDPYPAQLLETSRALAERLSLVDYQFAWQSAGRTPEPWLGPDILKSIDDLAKEGCRAVLVCPVGFISDNLEVLYDLDIEAKARAARLDMHFERTSSLNTDPGLIKALDRAVRMA